MDQSSHLIGRREGECDFEGSDLKGEAAQVKLQVMLSSGFWSRYMLLWWGEGDE